MFGEFGDNSLASDSGGPELLGEESNSLGFAMDTGYYIMDDINVSGDDLYGIEGNNPFE